MDCTPSELRLRYRLRLPMPRQPPTTLEDSGVSVCLNRGLFGQLGGLNIICSASGVSFQHSNIELKLSDYEIEPIGPEPGELFEPDPEPAPAEPVAPEVVPEPEYQQTDTAAALESLLASALDQDVLMPSADLENFDPLWCQENPPVLQHEPNFCSTINPDDFFSEPPVLQPVEEPDPFLDQLVAQCDQYEKAYHFLEAIVDTL